MTVPDHVKDVLGINNSVSEKFGLVSGHKIPKHALRRSLITISNSLSLPIDVSSFFDFLCSHSQVDLLCQACRHDDNRSEWTVHKVNVFDAFDEAGITGIPRPTKGDN